MTKGYSLPERPRRLRQTAAMRGLVSETTLSPGRLMLPMFFREGLSGSVQIDGMPGVKQHDVDGVVRSVEEALAAEGSATAADAAHAELSARDDVSGTHAAPEGHHGPPYDSPCDCVESL